MRAPTSIFLLFLLFAASVYAGDYDPFALDDPDARPGMRLECVLRLADFGYIEENAHSEVDDLKDARITMDMTVPWREHMLFLSGEANVRHAVSDTENEIVLKEAYFEWRSEIVVPPFFVSDTVVRFGQQIFSWGSGVMYNPTDNLSPVNAIDPFDAHSRGIPAVKLSFMSNVKIFDMIYIPGFVPSEISDIGHRFFIHSPGVVPNPNYPASGPPLLTMNYTDVLDDFVPEGDVTGDQYAVRYSTSFGNWDLGLSYFQGYENIALFEPSVTGVDATGVADTVVYHIHPKERVWGLDLSGFVGKLGVHVEGAYFDMRDTRHSVGIGDKDYYSVIGGFEYPINDIIGTQDLNISLEYAAEIKDEEDELIYINRIYPESVLVRFAHTMDYKLAFELRHVQNLDTESSYTRFQTDYRLSDYTKITFGFDVFEGPDNCFFGAYDDNDRVFIMMEYSR
ncbi:hypothetical protein ACFL01_04340 [Planctomycetota bacterium]